MATQKIETGLLADDSITADKLANSINTDIATGVAALPKAGGTMTGALVGTTAAFNSGTANVVASFTSTDTIAAIQLVDANGNVEIGAVGNDFHVMNAGGAAKMIVQSDGNVGIGNSSPQQRLTVGAGSGSELISIFAGTGSASGIHFTDTNTSGDDFQGFVTYDHSVDALRFGTAEEERVRIDVSGAVGIGQVPETARWSGHDILQVGGRATFLGNDTVSATGQTALLDNLYYDASGNFQHRGDSRGVAMQFVEGKIIFSNSNQTTGTPTVTPRMTLDGSGDVLIGQTSQTGYAFAQKLVVGDGDNNDGITIQSGSTHQGNLAFNHSDGTTAHGRISYQHSTNYMQFFANNSEKMRIVNNTASGAGGTSGNGVAFSNAGIAFDRSWGNFPGINVCNTSGTSQTNQSEFRIHGNNNTYNSYPSVSGSDFSVNLRIDGSTYISSDRRKKTEITSLTSAIDTVKQLDGKRFKIISSEGKTQDHLSKSGYTWGFIAQDIEDVVPDIVKHYEDEDDGTEEYNNAYAVNYAAMVALLTNAIKEQQTLIESLTARIDNAGL